MPKTTKTMNNRRAQIFPEISKIAVGLALMMAFAIISAVTSYAQLAGQGAIQGRITDPSGAVIPNATVTATNDATGVKTTRSTTSAGIYLLSPLPAGRYAVAAIANGFAKTIQEHVTVNAAESVGLDLQLKVGTQTESVTVSAAPPALDTTDATLSQTMENKTYAALPLEVNGGPRNPLAFATLMPGVATAAKSDMQSYNGGGGSAGRVNQLYVDGVPITADANTQPLDFVISVDAVNQFQTITSGASAQYEGMGSQNFDIKSGTNKFHGTVSDYIRNTAFDSWGFFAKAATVPNAAGQRLPAPKPAEHQNEFSATLGGPILRDRLFFFVAYDKYHKTNGGNPSLYSIPTLAERQGDFTALSYPIFDPTTYQACTSANNGIPCAYQFHGMLNGVDTPNVIPQGEISPQAQYMQQWLPQPTGPGTQNNFLAATPSGNNDWMLTARVDYQLTPNQRFSILSNSGIYDYIGLDNANGLPAPYKAGQNVTENAATGILEYNLVLSPRKVNSLKYGYVRTWVPTLNPWYGISKYEAASGVGIGNLPGGQASMTFPNLSFSGFADTPTSWPNKSNSSSEGVRNYMSLTDNFQWTAGKHNLTFGLVVRWLEEDQATPLSSTNPLSLQFSNVNTSGYSQGKVLNTITGNAYASYLLGAVKSSGMAEYPYSYLGGRYKTISPTFEDDWRVTPKLNLNLGLRWDIYTPYHEVLNRWSFLNTSAINPATGSLGAIEFAGNGAYSCHCKTPVFTYLGNLGPHLGAAYSINRKTVARAAFSTMFTNSGGVDGPTGQYNGTGQVGLAGSATFPGSGQSGAIPAFYLNANLPSPYANTSLPAFTATNNITPFRNPTVNAGNYINSDGVAVAPQGVSYADPHLSGRAPYAEYWNIGVQRAITNHLTLDVNYAGSESHFLWGASGERGRIINQLDPKYEVLGSLLKQLPGNVDKATGQTYLQEAQAIMPGIGLPYSNFGGPNATIEAMLVPYPQYGGITDTWGDVANAKYNSLQITLRQRSVHGVSYTINYTYDKATDDIGKFRTGYDIPSNAITDGIARKRDDLEYTAGTTEAPQILRAFGVWDLPFGRTSGNGAMRIANALIRDWSLSGIYSYTSGSPLAITASGCEIVGQGTCMPSYTPGYNKSPRINGGWGKGITSATASTTPFIDASAFTVPNKTYQLGNVPRTGVYNLFGPGSFNLDASLRRTFRITERINFIFQADAFNVTNAVGFKIASTSVTPAKAGSSQTYNSVGTNVGSSFGTISGQSNSPRDWQFAGKITF